MASTLKLDTIQHPSSANPNITLDTNGNATTSGAFVMSSSYLRNRIINGDMSIDQRNVGAAQTPTLATNAYTVDRWFLYSTGAAITTQRVAGTGPFQYSLKLTGAASNTDALFAQRIESVNCQDMSGATVTVQAYIWGSASGSVSWSLGYPTSGADNWSGSGTTAISSGSISFTTTPTRYTFTVTSLPANAVNGLQIYFDFGALGAGVTRNITGVQLEVGSVATPFERRQYGQELALCQRYLPAYKATSAGGVIGFGQAANGTIARAAVPFLVTPRVAPTGATFSAIGDFGFSANINMPATSQAAFYTATTLGGAVQITGAGTLTTLASGYLYPVNTNAQILWTGCEL